MPDKPHKAKASVDEASDGSSSSSGDGDPDFLFDAADALADRRTELAAAAAVEPVAFFLLCEAGGGLPSTTESPTTLIGHRLEVAPRPRFVCCIAFPRQPPLQ